MLPYPKAIASKLPNVGTTIFTVMSQLAAEHRAYPLALRLMAEGRVRVDGDKVTVRGIGAAGVLMSPGGA